MLTAVDIANYYAGKYANDTDKFIDEMKLHKLLYFAQRESLIQTGKPLFEEDFYGWKYGPVLKSIRTEFKHGKFSTPNFSDIPNNPVLDVVYDKYAFKDSWYLSTLSHTEFSWKKSRSGLSANENGSRPIPIEDIMVDAKRVKARRENLRLVSE